MIFLHNISAIYFYSKAIDRQSTVLRYFKMNKFLSAMTIAISTIIATSSVFAAPNTHHDNHSTQQHQTQQHQTQNHSNQHKVADQKPQGQNNAWKVGQAFPSQYRTASHKFDYKHNKNLSKPSQNQQWYKVDGKYVLINISNHKIVKVIR